MTTQNPQVTLTTDEREREQLRIKARQYAMSRWHPSLKDVIRSAGQNLARSAQRNFLPSALPQLDIGIDLSGWTPLVKASELANQGIAWIAGKAVEVDDRVWGWNANMSLDAFCTSTLAAQCQLAADIGAKFMPYIFDNPQYKESWGGNPAAWPSNDLEPMILAMRQQLKNKLYHAIGVDLERWWESYDELRQTPTTARKIPALWILMSAQNADDRIKHEIKAGNFRDVPIIYYTGKWFVDGYAPGLDTFLSTRFQWLASYPQPFYSQVAGLHTIAEIKTLIGTILARPAWVGNKECELQQMADNVTIPGVYATDGVTRAAVDINRLVAGSMNTVFAGDPVPPPPPPVPTCPAGQHWDAGQGKCVNDTVTPPPPTGDLATVLANLATLQADVNLLQDGVTTLVSALNETELKVDNINVTTQQIRSIYK